MKIERGKFGKLAPTYKKKKRRMEEIPRETKKENRKITVERKWGKYVKERKKERKT